uniref:Uncharacterized protein n=1 Tax=Calidris pygmaea TaxID=425635 RepID=A0A8C3J6F5_9CHAR
MSSMTKGKEPDLSLWFILLHAFSPFQIFAAEGTKLASALHAFSDQVRDDDKSLLLLEAEKLVSMCKQLQITAKASVQGKSATFTKVDACILKTRNVMTLLCQLLPLCCRLLRKASTWFIYSVLKVAGVVWFGWFCSWWLFFLRKLFFIYIYTE